MPNPRATRFGDIATPGPVARTTQPGATPPPAGTPPPTAPDAPNGRTQAQWLLDLINGGRAPQDAIDVLNKYGAGYGGAAYYNDARGQTIGLNSVNGYLNRNADGQWALVMRPSAEGGATPTATAAPNTFAGLVAPTFGTGSLPVPAYTPIPGQQFAPLPPPAGTTAPAAPAQTFQPYPGMPYQFQGGF